MATERSRSTVRAKKATRKSLETAFRKGYLPTHTHGLAELQRAREMLRWLVESEAYPAETIIPSANELENITRVFESELDDPSFAITEKLWGRAIREVNREDLLTRHQTEDGTPFWRTVGGRTQSFYPGMHPQGRSWHASIRENGNDTRFEPGRTLSRQELIQMADAPLANTEIDAAIACLVHSGTFERKPRTRYQITENDAPLNRLYTPASSASVVAQQERAQTTIKNWLGNLSEDPWREAPSGQRIVGALLSAFTAGDLQRGQYLGTSAEIARSLGENAETVRSALVKPMLSEILERHRQGRGLAFRINPHASPVDPLQALEKSRPAVNRRR